MRAGWVFMLVAGAVATGCAQPPAPTSVPTPTPVSIEPPMQADAVPRGRAQIIVNGRAGPTGPVVCDTGAGLTTITIGESSLGVSAIVTADTAPTVRSVSIGDVGGVALAFAAGTTARTPTAQRNGATLIITGSGSGTDSADPARIVDSGYRIAVACP